MPRLLLALLCLLSLAACNAPPQGRGSSMELAPPSGGGGSY